MRRLQATILGVTLLQATGACVPIGEPAEERVTVRGAIFTEFHVEATCAEQVAPPELTGVALTFVDAGGDVLGTARTGDVEGQDLPPGPGKPGWRAFGCRFLAPYSIELPELDRYQVHFTPTLADAASSFRGVEALEPQAISRAELEANQFEWSFEAPPEYVVP